MPESSCTGCTRKPKRDGALVGQRQLAGRADRAQIIDSLEQQGKLTPATFKSAQSISRDLQRDTGLDPGRANQAAATAAGAGLGAEDAAVIGQLQILGIPEPAAAVGKLSARTRQQLLSQARGRRAIPDIPIEVLLAEELKNSELGKPAGIEGVDDVRSAHERIAEAERLVGRGALGVVTTGDNRLVAPYNRSLRPQILDVLGFDKPGYFKNLFGFGGPPPDVIRDRLASLRIAAERIDQRRRESQAPHPAGEPFDEQTRRELDRLRNTGPPPAPRIGDFSVPPAGAAVPPAPTSQPVIRISIGTLNARPGRGWLRRGGQAGFGTGSFNIASGGST